MRLIKQKLAAFGRIASDWYNRRIRVEPGSLVWPEPRRPRAARIRVRPDRRS
jgi:hypothetical protein